MSSTLNNLPAELKKVVFSKLGVNKSHLCNYILVCSSWKLSFEENLYRRIVIHDLTQLTKLLRTLETNEHTSCLIKRITIKFENNSSDAEECTTNGKFFTQLPNVEFISCTSGSYYKFISDALSRNQLPQLNYLIPPTTDKDMDDYITCAIMLRDRLKTLKMSERTYLDPLQQVISAENSVRFNRLFDIFNEFKYLNRLRIGKRKDNIIDLIEKVTVICPLLNDLFLDVSPIEADNSIIIEDVTHYLPVTNITNLTIRTGVLQQSRNILYMIRKFPCLAQLKTIGQEQKTFNVDRYTLEKWMNYIKDIKCTNITRIPCLEMEAKKLLGPIWKSVSEKRTVLATFVYNDTNRVWDSLDFSSERDQCETKLFFSTLQHVKLIQNYGRFIKALKFEGVSSTLLTPLQQQEDLSLYEVVILLPLRYCAPLYYLLVVSCAIDSFDIPNSDIIRKKSFGTLGIADSTIENNAVLTSIFKLFDQIEFLQLYRLRFMSHPEDDTVFLRDIDLRETNVGTLSLFKHPIFNDLTLERTILVKISIQSTNRYYVYDHELMKSNAFIPCNVELYDFGRVHEDERKWKKCIVIGITCKSLKKLEVVHKRGTITLLIK